MQKFSYARVTAKSRARSIASNRIAPHLNNIHRRLMVVNHSAGAIALSAWRYGRSQERIGAPNDSDLSNRSAACVTHEIRAAQTPAKAPGRPSAPMAGPIPVHLHGKCAVLRRDCRINTLGGYRFW
jgi:hypothetical protein